ncbi:uncharacterized protein LOC128645890 isoform X2 [Bombina bombina]|uniref:uncharacterized protein LOC128645890 isoform X2 n=1 Tax=Bombina bombina TaxID=8345 RepID=UPI00235A8381|nr:uncharacterized protein LOC128645890 isoform X2 [Bombina bombina]
MVDWAWILNLPQLFMLLLGPPLGKSRMLGPPPDTGSTSGAALRGCAGCDLTRFYYKCYELLFEAASLGLPPIFGALDEKNNCHNMSSFTDLIINAVLDWVLMTNLNFLTAPLFAMSVQWGLAGSRHGERLNREPLHTPQSSPGHGSPTQSESSIIPGSPPQFESSSQPEELSKSSRTPLEEACFNLAYKRPSLGL